MFAAPRGRCAATPRVVVTRRLHFRFNYTDLVRNRSINMSRVVKKSSKFFDLEHLWCRVHGSLFCFSGFFVHYLFNFLMKRCWHLHCYHAECSHVEVVRIIRVRAPNELPLHAIRPYRRAAINVHGMALSRRPYWERDLVPLDTKNIRTVSSLFRVDEGSESS